jgi:hypothetical protein
MTTFPGSPRLARGGIVLLDSSTSRVIRVIALQNNQLGTIEIAPAEGPLPLFANAIHTGLAHG